MAIQNKTSKYHQSDIVTILINKIKVENIKNLKNAKFFITPKGLIDKFNYLRLHKHKLGQTEVSLINDWFRHQYTKSDITASEFKKLFE